MKKQMRILGLATCVALIGPGVAQADSHKGSVQGAVQMRPDFDAIDTDDDGRITEAELTAYMGARFDAADSDGDGMLSREELVTHMMTRQADRMARRADRMIDRYDTDGDGQLSRQEMQDRRQGGMMTRMDLDSDGAISREGFAKGYARHGDRRHGGKNRNADE